MNTTTQAIKQIDIVQVIGQYVNLKKRGVNYVGLCPFHKEKTPSFSVNPKKKIWKCFGCGEGGDVMDFITKHTGKSFTESLPLLRIEPDQQNAPFRAVQQEEPPLPVDYLPPAIVTASMQRYDQNNFVLGLRKLFDNEIVDKTIETFCIGSAKLWTGATNFWYKDIFGRYTQVKTMLYHPENLKRVKKDEPPKVGKSKALFFGKPIYEKLYKKEPNLQTCWFGEHLLNDHPSKAVAIVESEKTAILMTVFGWLNYPVARNYIWLATGGKQGGQFKKMEVIDVLYGKEVVLFPDIDGYEEWQDLKWNLVGCTASVSKMLLKHRIEGKKDKRDIADFFLATHLNGNRPEPTPPPKAAAPSPVRIESGLPNLLNEPPPKLSKVDNFLLQMKRENPKVGKLVRRLGLVPI